MKQLLAFTAGILLTLMVMQISAPEGSPNEFGAEVPLNRVYPYVKTDDQAFDFGGSSSYVSSYKRLRRSHDEQQMTLSFETRLATIRAGDVELVCFETQPYDDGTYQLSAEIYLTTSGQTKFLESIAHGKGELLTLKYSGLTIEQFITDDESVENYDETRQRRISKELNPLGRYSDFKFAAWKNNHFALMALVRHLSPEKAPTGCSAEDTPEQIPWWAETVKELWR